MFDWLFPSRRSSERTSPADERQSRAGDPGTVISHPRGAGDSLGERGDPRLGEPRYIDTHQGSILSVRFSPDGTHVVVGCKDGVVQRWKVEQGDDYGEVENLVHSEGGLSATVVSKDGRWIILVGIQGRTFTVWDAITHEKVADSMEAHEREITALDISPDACKVASGSRDGAVIVWCLKTGQCLAGPFNQGCPVLSVQFSPTGERIASVGWHYSIRVWDMSNEHDESATSVLADPACSLAWSKDGRRLFVGCHRGSILGFDLSTSTLMTLKRPGHPHVDSISTLCISNNAKFVASSSSSESCLRLWDSHTLLEIASLPHSCEVFQAETSHDDSYLVIGGKGGQICIWNLRKVLPLCYFLHSLTARLSLPCQSDAYPILTNVSNAAYVLWRSPELAEDILSSEIKCNSGRSHYTLANRALVRTRLRQWDMALSDADASLRVEPSLIARLAKGVARIGKTLHSAAIDTLDDALENCHSEEKSLVIVIKAIALFDSGLHEEAICHLNGLVDHSPAFKDPCRFVQAKMHALLASKASDDHEHVKATRLLAQARDLCPSFHYPEIDVVSFISGWDFDGLRLAIYRQLCEAHYAAGHIHQVQGPLRDLENSFRHEIKLRGELNEWLVGFKSQCIKILENRGDEAMVSKDYDNAIAQYSVALAMSPALPLAATLFTRRSEARIATCSWHNALKDADEAIKLEPSSPWGYERRHAALHKLGRYEEAIAAMKMMLSILAESADPEVQDLRTKYVHPSDTEKAIWKVFSRTVHNSPFRLIDTTSGYLCDAERRKKMFTEDPIYLELVSSVTTELRWEHIDAVTKKYFQYVMLSHRWEDEELGLADVVDKSVYELEASPSSRKLERFCTLARNSKFRWAWSDTCCINKDKDVEFERSINSMFHWYRGSAATIVYLTSVPPKMIRGALEGSIWMKRGWTLQELLAPPIIRFYYEDWTPYLNDTSLNHKESAVIMQELEDVTGVLIHDLLTFRPGPENARVKLRLASTRETTVPVDMAYGLFGIFGITMPVIHGESQENALGRLFQEIVARSGDVACLAWVGRSSGFNSAFPGHIHVYRHAFHTVPLLGEGDMERAVIDLQSTWAEEQALQAVAFHDKLRKLPPARCIHHRIHLPCIVFPLIALKRVERTDGLRTYHATASALQDTEVRTKERLQSHGAEGLVLACPWIYELLDSAPPCQGHYPHRQQSSGDAESLDDLELTVSEPELGRETPARAVALDSRSEDPASVLLSDSGIPHRPLPIVTQTPDTALEACRLVVRFRQPLGALLLFAQGHGQYRRVATDHEIILRVRDDVSVNNMDLRTLEIL